jgi:prevent-host-death family protein
MIFIKRPAGQMALDSTPGKCNIPRMMVRTEIIAGQLAELVKKVQAGDEVLLTQGNKPVAKLVPAHEEAAPTRAAQPIRSVKGHRVLTPVISQEELAEEMFRGP